MNDDILYIGAFLGSVILINSVAGNKATYYYLLLVLAGVMVANVGKYNVKIVTPEIMQSNVSSTHNSSSNNTHGGSGRNF